MSKYVIGNWKLNPATVAQAAALAQDLLNEGQCVIGVVPSFVHLTSVKSALMQDIMLGVQDIAHKTAQIGAFTGDVSAVQVADLGAKFTLVGHSERRQYHGENDEVLTAKIHHAFEAGLSVVYCIGESKDEYTTGKTQTVLQKQLALLQNFAKEIPLVEDVSFPKLIIAYEPVWAIGTGLTPTFEEVESVHNFIREQLSAFGICSPILYGGSVNDKNAPEFAKSSVIDGALVGGASLKAESFLAIAQAFS